MDPVTDSGGRVTRSLRKRIPSVDCDNSSRPGTPVLSKLAAVTEISSPSRPARITRRNSTSGMATPVKTPGKRGGAITSVISESTENVTPARRSMRRRSVSTNESEDTPQPSLKTPAFESLTEEIVPISKQIKYPLSRSPSKSPQENKHKNSEEKLAKSGITQQYRKPGPKCMTQHLKEEQDDDLSDVEVIVVERIEQNENRNKSNITIIDLIDGDDKTQQLDNANLIEKKDESAISKTSPRISLSEKNIKNTNFATTRVSADEKNNNKSNVCPIDLMSCEKNSQQLDNTKLVTEELINEKKQSNISSTFAQTSENKIFSKTQEEKITCNTDVPAIDLMNCDDDSQELSNNKLNSDELKQVINKAALPNASSITSLTDKKFENESCKVAQDEQDNSNISKVSTDDLMNCDDKSQQLDETKLETFQLKQENNKSSMLNSSHQTSLSENEKENSCNETNVSIIDLMNCDDESQQLNNTKLSADKLSQTNLNETAGQQKEIINEKSSINTNVGSITLVDGDDKSQKFDNTKLSADKLPQEKNKECDPKISSVIELETNNVASSQDKQILNDNFSDTNVSTIDLIDDDDECQQSHTTNLDANKLPQKDTQIATSINSQQSSLSKTIYNGIDLQKSVKSTEKERIVNKEQHNDLDAMAIDSTIITNKPEPVAVNETIIYGNDECQQLNIDKLEAQKKSPLEYKQVANLIKTTQSSVSKTVIDHMDIQTTTGIKTANKEHPTDFVNESKISSPLIKNEQINDEQIDDDETVDSNSDIISNDAACSPSKSYKITTIALNDNIKTNFKLDLSNELLQNDGDCVPPKTLLKSTATIIEVITLTPTKLNSVATVCKSSKKVDFIPSPSNDNCIKTVYPKTPSQKKAKVCIENKVMEIDEHKDLEDLKQEPLNCEKNKPESDLKSVHQLNISQNFKPIVKATSETENDMHRFSEDQEAPFEKSSLFNSQKENNCNDIVSAIEDEESSLQEIEKEHKLLEWQNPSVKGITEEGSKLDAVVKPKETPYTHSSNDESESDQDTKCIPRKGSAIVFSSESDNAEDEEDIEELAPGEEPYKRQHVFHDDEAMEVDDYQSGDSMDSEERREMLENEVPVDGESIGSHTTDEEHDEYDEGEESDHSDSFIVSDNEEEIQLECSDSDDEDEIEDIHDRKKKKTYKRIQRTTENSSSSEDLDDEKTHKTQSSTSDSPKKINTSMRKSVDNNILNSSKLSDTALRLHCTAESESEDFDGENVNKSRKEILRNLNQSDRFNKSVRDLNLDVDTSPIHLNDPEQSLGTQIQIAADPVTNKKHLDKSISHETTVIEEEKNKLEDEEQSCAASSSADSDVNNLEHATSSRKRSESHLGDVSITTESEGDKENENQKFSNSRNNVLNVSFGNFNKPKNNSKERSEWQRSFTIGVSVKGGDLGTAVTENKSTKEISSSSSSESNDDDKLSSDDALYLENIKHMPLPLGNPLVRTRRQSLALPTNPDMEICSSSNCNKNSKMPKRKSLGVLSGNEFNPSQSFIDSMELRKNEFDRQTAKRKRLSKSFCGASETFDNSIIDIDVRHLHKRSKLAADRSIMENDSIENINNISKISSKITLSSTPREKCNKNDSITNYQRILSRCEEILEAANRAKLEDKLKNKKNKVKPQKRNKKRTAQQTIRDLHEDSDSKSNINEIKRKDKTKAALAQAFKAADIIIGKKKEKPIKRVEQHTFDSKRLPPDALEAVSEPIARKIKKDTKINNEWVRNYSTTSTAAGNFMEMPQTPEKKKKKAKIIQLSTGKVCVEPVTPKKRSVLACNGTEFRESPITPFPLGFKVRQISLGDDYDRKQSSILKDRKRKRNFEEPNRHSRPKPMWTQSGLFIEEEIPTVHQIARSELSQLGGSRRLKKHQTENIEQNAHWNFKENTLLRGDIKRITNRELLLLKERRQMQSHF